MTDPKRWLDEPPFAGSLAPQLILAGRRLELPPQALERSWAEFSAGIALGTAVVTHATEAAGSATATGASAAGASAGGATVVGLPSAALVKSFVVGALLGVGAASAVPAVRYVTRPAPSAGVEVAVSLHASAGPARASDASSGSRAVGANAAAELQPPGAPSPTTAGLASAAVAPRLAAPRTASSPALPAASAAHVFPDPASGRSPESPPSLPDANRLKLEALELAKAKNLLESGDPRGALGILQESRARFANGAMIEERDALMIEALAKQGDTALARDAALRFVVRFPKSALAERVKQISDLK